MTEPADVVDRVIAFLDDDRRKRAADLLREQRDAVRGDRPRLVVAGEDKRGKSSLVNALLGAADLSPVGAKVVTGTPVRFEYAAEPGAAVYRYGSADPEPVDLDTARRLATVEGNPGNAENIETIAIGLPLPILEAMEIVDTPGVGGLSSGHAALTMQSLNDADALLFVVDAAAPMRAAELDFLRRASARLQAVVLVLTKIDVHPGWRQTLADDQRILAEQAPRFTGCPSAGVSSASALRALALDDAEFAAEIRTESGIGGLAELLRTTIITAVDTVRLQNLLRACVSRLSAVERDLADRRAASEPDGGDMLQTKLDALAALRRERVDWQAALDAEIRKLMVQRADVCTRRVREIRVRYQDRARDAKAGEFQTMPGEVLAELTALAGELNEYAVDQLTEITEKLLADLDAEISVAGMIDQIGATGIGESVPRLPRNRRQLGHGARMELLSELGRGRSLLSLASGSSVLAFLAPPFGLVLGAGLGGLFAFTSWRAQSRQGQAADFQIWLQEQVANADLTIRNTFAVQVVDLQNGIKAAVRAVLGDRERELEAAVDEARTLRRAAASARAERQRQLDGRIAAARALRLDAIAALRTVEPPE